jgi:hypothetical protein
MDLTEHYHGLTEDVVGQHKPLDREVDLAVTYGLFPVEGAPAGSMSIGIMVVMIMKSILLGQYLSQMSVIYGPRPDDAQFRDMVKGMIVKMRAEYDALASRQLLGPAAPFTVPVRDDQQA